MLLWIKINERGEVVDVSAADSTPNAGFVFASRPVLLAVRFEPARRGERAVRSRILLSVTPAASSEDAPGGAAGDR